MTGKFKVREKKVGKLSGVASLLRPDRFRLHTIGNYANDCNSDYQARLIKNNCAENST